MMPHHPHGIPNSEKGQLRVLAWETTKACPLACPHCRASAVDHRDPDELSTEEGYKMLESAAEVGKSIIILSIKNLTIIIILNRIFEIFCI